MASNSKQITGTGDVTLGPTRLAAITAAVDIGGTLTLRDGGSGGTIKATLDFVAGNAHLPALNMRFNGGLHATFTTLVGTLTMWLSDA